MELTNYSSRTAEVKAIIASFMADKEEPVERKEIAVFFVKYFSLKKASEFPFFSKGFSLPSAGIMHPCA